MKELLAQAHEKNPNLDLISLFDEILTQNLKQDMHR